MFIIKHLQYFLIAGAFIVAGSLALIITFGFPLGIDFTGGSLTEVSYSVRPDKVELERALDAHGEKIGLGVYSLRATVEETGRDGYILRTRDLTEPERQSVETVLLGLGEDTTLDRFTSIGPVIGEELKNKAVFAVGTVIVVIILFVAFAFRSVSRPVGSWVYGGITILALIHDVLVPTALMSFLGYAIGAEMDILFVMAMLAILGYSVNDTIIIFDRVRENLNNNQEKDRHEPFDVVVGRSIDQTMMRSINTSFTTFLALGALYFLGGEVTQNFALILMVGVIAGTYSSICIANPLLVFVGRRKTHEKNKKK